MKQINVKMVNTGVSVEIDRNAFGLALQTWRIRMGFTQKQVAQRFGVSRHTIIRAENAQDMTWQMCYRLYAKLCHELDHEAGAPSLS